MKLLFLTSGPLVPSTRYRMLQYASNFRAAGHVCHFFHSRPGKYRDCWPLLPDANSRLRRWKRTWDWWRAWIGRYDIIIIERELFTDASIHFEECFSRLKVPLVLDVDDGIFLNQPEKFARLFPLVDLVIAGCAAIQDYARQHTQKTLVIPTCVDIHKFKPLKQVSTAQQADTTTIGWTGLACNLPYLHEIAHALRTLSQTHRIELLIIADHIDPLQQELFAGIPIRFQEWQPQQETAGLENMHIGVMPLPDNPWERYKCGFKLIQYQSMGIPVVASAVGVNHEIIRAGENGFLAISQADWENSLQRLICSPSLRQEMGMHGRQLVEQHYSIQSQFPRLLQALEELHRRRRA